MKKTDIELLSEVDNHSVDTIKHRLRKYREVNVITYEQALTLLSLKSQQMQSEVDELKEDLESKTILLDACKSANEHHISEMQRLKQRCEELEKYADHIDGCELLPPYFQTDKCTCGLSDLISPPSQT